MNTDYVNRVSGQVIRCAFNVSNALGAGFLEKVYENALAHEIRKAGLNVTQQHEARVLYDGVIVGRYTIDLVVEKLVLIELKAVRTLEDIHYAQCLNYLKTSGQWLCLLLNFGKPRLQIKRIVNGSLEENRKHG
jgi:GxxExxY protein